MQIVEPAIQPKLTFTWRIMPQNPSVTPGISWKVQQQLPAGSTTLLEP